MKMIRADFGRSTLPHLRVVAPRTGADVLLLAAVQLDLIQRSLGSKTALNLPEPQRQTLRQPTLTDSV